MIISMIASRAYFQQLRWFNFNVALSNTKKKRFISAHTVQHTWAELEVCPYSLVHLRFRRKYS